MRWGVQVTTLRAGPTHRSRVVIGDATYAASAGGGELPSESRVGWEVEEPPMWKWMTLRYRRRRGMFQETYRFWANVLGAVSTIYRHEGSFVCG